MSNCCHWNQHSWLRVDQCSCTKEASTIINHFSCSDVHNALTEPITPFSAPTCAQHQRMIHSPSYNMPNSPFALCEIHLHAPLGNWVVPTLARLHPAKAMYTCLQATGSCPCRPGSTRQMPHSCAARQQGFAHDSQAALGKGHIPALPGNQVMPASAGLHSTKATFTRMLCKQRKQHQHQHQ